MTSAFPISNFPIPIRQWPITSSIQNKLHSTIKAVKQWLKMKQYSNIICELKVVSKKEGEGRLVLNAKERKKQWGSSLTCLELDAVLEPALCLSVLKHSWPKYSSCAELYRESMRAKMKGEEQRLSASIQQSGWGSTAGCQPLCCVCCCLFHSLSWKEEERDRVSAMGMFFSSHSFSRLFLTCEEQTARKGEWTRRRRRRRNRSPTCGTETTGPSTALIRVMIFIMITQHKSLLFEMQVSALCSQDSRLQFDLSWDHVCLWFVGETQPFHCILKLKTTAV